MSYRILIVEDDQRLGKQMVEGLGLAGFSVEWIEDGEAAFEMIPTRFDLVVLDLMLPGRNGMDILQAWRQHSDVPVLILTAKADTPDKVQAFALGADDYLTKPFWPEELVARIHARLRRPTMQRSDRLVVGALEIELGARRGRVSGEELELTPVEFSLLAELCRRHDQALSRKSLSLTAFGDESQERNLDVHISRIRKKLGAASEQLQTVWGIGYRMSSETDRKP